MRGACLVFPATLAFALLASCTEESTGPAPPSVALIEVVASADTLTAIDQTVQLSAVAKDASGAAIPGATFTWSSDQPLVISVTTSSAASVLGTATGGGAALVTATSGGQSGAVRVHVVQKVSTLEVSPETWAAGWVGARQRFTVAAKDSNGHEVPDAEGFVWSSGDDAVAVVDAAGVATAVAAGETDVTATLAALSDNADVTVVAGGAALPKPGLVYTVWPATLFDSPAYLVNGSLKTPAGGDWVLWGESNVAKFQWWGGRIGLLTDVVGGVGTFRVRDRQGEWTTLALGDAEDFRLQGEHIVLLHADGRLRAKIGIHGDWTVLASGGVRDFVTESTKIGVVYEDGSVKIRNGIGALWVDQDPGGPVRELVLAGDRVGVLMEDGGVLVKDGTVSAAWTELAPEGVQKLVMAGDVIGMIWADSATVWAKIGIHGAWYRPLASDVADLQIAVTPASATGYRIAVLNTSGVLYGKDDIAVGWTPLSDGVDEFQLQQNWIGARSGTVLRVKQGLGGLWDDEDAGGTIEQFRPVVDLPEPPYRTTPTLYANKQAECVAWEALSQPKCYTPWQTAVPVPYYGRFCGWGRPGDDNFAEAKNLGPIDGMDFLCMHHDRAEFWYPEVSGESLKACIVYYGFIHSRLTQDGVLLASGSDIANDPARWSSAWGSRMPNLKSVIDEYFTLVDPGFGGCDELATFADLTGGKHY